MKSFMMTAMASAAAAAMLVACGGAGESNDVQTGPTEQQAKLLAARTIHAVFVADSVAFDVAAGGQASAASGAVAFGHHTVPCAQGSGTVTLHDSDNSSDLSAGDVELFVLTDCQRHADSRWALAGTPVLTLLAADLPAAQIDPPVTGRAALASGSETGDATALTTRVTSQDLSFGNPSYGSQALFAGQWTSTGSTLAGQAHLRVQFNDATLALGDVLVRFDQVSFVANGAIIELQGQVATVIEGLGDIVAGLTLGSILPVAEGKGWYAPTGGVAKVTTATLVMEVAYAADGAVTLRLDNGIDGTVDLTVQTSQAELDQLLTTRAVAPVPPSCEVFTSPDGLPADCFGAGSLTARTPAAATPRRAGVRPNIAVPAQKN